MKALHRICAGPGLAAQVGLDEGVRAEGQAARMTRNVGDAVMPCRRSSARAVLATFRLILVVVATGVMLSACGSVEKTTKSSAPVSPMATSSTASPSSPNAVGSSDSTSARDVNIVHDVRYMTQRPGWIPSTLDVYAPKDGGPWPLVVMLHGAGLTRDWLTEWALKAAQRGAVVFVPDWGLADWQVPDPATLSPKRLSVTCAQGHRDLAAVVRFARGSAARYGGDKSRLTLFGHSAGANEAVMEAFSGVAASEGGLNGTGSTVPDALVLLDPDLLLAGDPMWDQYLASRPEILQLLTPWQYVDRRVDFTISVICSGDPALTRPARHIWGKDSWLGVRDPSGDLRRGLQRVGAFRGGRFVNDGALKLLVKRLRAAGDEASYIQLTDSTHTVLGDRGMESLLNSLVPNTQP